MYDTILSLHSFLPYLLMPVLLISIFIFLSRRSSGKEFKHTDKMFALATLILTHLQFVIGLILYFISPKGIAAFGNEGVMSDDNIRFYAVEHIVTMLVAVIMITVGYSGAKRAIADRAKYSKLIIFYIIGLVLMLAMVPWDVWPSFI